MGAGFEAQQAVQQIVSLPRPQPHIPGIDVAPGSSRLGPKHAGAMTVRQRQRPLQLRTLEILSAMTLHDAERARMLGQRGGIREHAVQHQPLVRGQGGEPLLRQAPLEGGSSLLHFDPRGGQRARRLAGVVGRKLEHPHVGGLERPAHARRKPVEPRDRHLFRGFRDRAETAIRPAPADRGGGVGPHDRRDAAVPHHAPLLDTVQKAHGGGRQRPGVVERVHAQLRVLDRVGARELLEVAATQARIRNVGGRHRPRGHDRLDPRAGNGHRVRSAQPR